jgi:hypothetical protein
VRESLLVLYVLKREQIEHARTRVLAQTLVDKDKGVEAFEQYRKVAFPWAEAHAKAADRKMVERLMNEVGAGALAVRPLEGAPMRSRLRTKRERSDR